MDSIPWDSSPLNQHHDFGSQDFLWHHFFLLPQNLRKPGSESFNLMFMWERSLQLKKS